MTAEFRIGQGTLHQAQDFFQLALQILTLRFGWRGSLPAQQDLCDRIIQNTDIAFAHYDHFSPLQTGFKPLSNARPPEKKPQKVVAKATPVGVKIGGAEQFIAKNNGQSA